MIRYNVKILKAGAWSLLVIGHGHGDSKQGSQQGSQPNKSCPTVVVRNNARAHRGNESNFQLYMLPENVIQAAVGLPIL